MSIDDDSVFVPRYLKNVESSMASCTNQNDLNVLMAKKAGYLARHSMADEARAIIINLRDRNKDYDPRLTGWTTLSEGFITHFENLDNQGSKSKFARSFMMGQVAQDKELTSVSAAWLANSEYALGELKSSIDHLSTSILLSLPTDGDTRGRALLLLGDMLYWCGKATLARHWYRESRKHAVRDGDIAMQNIILFNTANYAVWNLTLQDCKVPLESTEWRLVSVEVASARNLNSALRINNLPSLIPTMEAELKVAQRNWRESEEIFGKTLRQLGGEGLQRAISKMFAQRAWCRANLGDQDGTRSDIADALLQISDCEDVDDLYVLHSRVSKASALIGDSDVSDRHHRLAHECGQLFFDQQEQTYLSLTKIVSLLATETKNPA